MEKRAILAFVLMALVLVVSQYLLTPRTRPQPQEEAEPGAVEAPSAPPVIAPREVRARPDSGDFFAAPGGETVHVSTPLYRLEIDPAGGVVTSVYLERYQSYLDSLPVELVRPGAAFLQRELRVGTDRLPLTDVAFQPSAASVDVAASDSLILTATAGGRPIRQVYVFDAETYELGYRFEVGGLTASDAILETHLGPELRASEPDPKAERANHAVVVRVDGEVHTLKVDDVEEPVRFAGAVSWGGIKSKYFLAAILADERPLSAVAITPLAADTTRGADVAVFTSPLDAGRTSYRVFLGPQEFRSLSGAGAALEDVNQYGWSWIRWMIQPFAHFIIRVLLWMHQYVPNYGVVLIIFGVLVRLLMWPLTQKSFESMQRMQTLQPEMNRLRDRYKNDPQRMQQEVMRLYRERGVNPLGGCLPNLLPLPVLFALFFVFQNTIEFRGAPFALWIQDLSRPDPYYVLPILMGVTMFIQQKLSSTAQADNPQMKMMLYFMPAFLTFIFLNLAAGLDH